MRLPFPDQVEETPVLHTTGVLPSQWIRDLVSKGGVAIRDGLAGEIKEDQIQPASIDLRLGEVAYRVQGSFLPGKLFTVEDKIKDLKMAEIDLRTSAVLEKECVYIIPLIEKLFLPDNTSAKANPKSTTGRLDIFTRLITDNGEAFDWVGEGYKGKLYAEVVPGTFSVRVSTGAKLNQIRFVRGKPESTDTDLNELDQKHGLIFLNEEMPGKAEIDDGLWINVSTQGENPQEIVAYKGKRNAPVIDLSKVNCYEPEDFWDIIRAPRNGRIILDPRAFYIMASTQKVRVPPERAAELRPLETSVGEFRIHYAGFFDPGFGYGLNDIKGTKAVLEVRAHEIPVVIEHDQPVGSLTYMRLLEPPDKVYGAKIGSSYQGQALALSKQFKRDPD